MTYKLHTNTIRINTKYVKLLTFKNIFALSKSCIELYKYNDLK